MFRRLVGRPARREGPETPRPTGSPAQDDPSGEDPLAGPLRSVPPAPPAPAAPAADDRPAPRPQEAEPATIETGVERSRRGFVTRLRTSFRGDPAAEETWDDVEETLIAADVGAGLALRLVARARARTHQSLGGPEQAVRQELARLFAPRDPTPWPRKPAPDVPAVVLVVGVNGTGKTTTIAKLGARFSRRGARVLLAAGDTFRAAGIEQLGVWADRLDLPVVAHAPGADPAAVVYDALDAAVARGIDVLVVDTAGRLHTKSNLMDELAKIRRTISRRVPAAQPEVLFVLDATTGQNGLAQAQAFHASSGLTGIALTKLDSTAKGGIVFAIEDTLGVPVLFVGVGERPEDLVDFDPASFLEALFA